MWRCDGLPGDLAVGGEKSDQHGRAESNNQTDDDKVCVPLETFKQMFVLVVVDLTFVVSGLHGVSLRTLF